ncbi:MAG: hypothetical protein FJZ38_06595 [Candidatus Rokubacteria bacterium]|nr:hypothetical protein [Candidatus Rokubacteria bacterium]
MKNERRHVAGLPSSSGTNERPWMCGPGCPPPSSISVGAMSSAITIWSIVDPARLRRVQPPSRSLVARDRRRRRRS